MKMLKIVAFEVAAVIVIVVSGMTGYLAVYYHAEDTSKEYLQSSEIVEIKKIDEGYFFDGEGTNKALIFYPGAKVETESYARLMKKIAESGIDCFLVDMPFRFAFFEINKADKILENYQYENWMICGHSLGGVAADMYLKNHSDKFSGLVLIGSYPTSKVPENVKLYSIYGSNDGVLNQESYINAKQYWNSNSEELIITGANHACIGDYGVQAKDGELTITRDDVIAQIIEFIK